MSSPALPPMGWYADPAGSSQERYWDGATWTANLRDVPDPQTGSVEAAPDRRSPGPSGQQGSPGTASANVVQTSGKQTMTADGVPLAGWWWRVLATVVDQVVISVLAVIPAWPWIQTLRAGFSQIVSDTMVATRNGAPPPAASDYSDLLNAPMVYLQLTMIGVGAFYLLVSYLVVGRTLGNMVTGTWVVRVDRGLQRGRLSPVVAAGRTLAITAILLMNQILVVLWLADVVTALFTSRRQTLHDLMSNTQVVRPSSRPWR